MQPIPQLRFGLAVVAAGLLPVLACQPPSSASAEESASGGARKREIPRVRAVEVQRREMIQVLETTSTLESEREIQVFPRLPGTALEVLAEEGDEVREGQVLARLDDGDQVLAVSDAEVALANAENAAAQAELSVQDAASRVDSTRRAADQAQRDYERDVRLYEGQDAGARVVSEQKVETSRLAWENTQSEHELAKITASRSRLEAQASKIAVERAKVALERAKLTLGHMRIVAPFGGVVAMRTVRVGDAVGTGEAAFVLTDVEHLRSVFLRPQEELELFARAGEGGGRGGLTFHATAEAYPGREFTGYVERISPTIDAASGQFRVTARLAADGGTDRRDGDTEPRADGGARLLPGMLMRLHIVTDRHADALVVPKRAVRREGERRYVLRITEEEAGATVQRVDVREAFDSADDVEVVPFEPGALEEGTTIVLVGSRDLTDGDRVTIDDGRDATAPGDMGAMPEGVTDPPDGQPAEAPPAADEPQDAADAEAATADAE